MLRSPFISSVAIKFCDFGVEWSVAWPGDCLSFLTAILLPSFPDVTLRNRPHQSYGVKPYRELSVSDGRKMATRKNEFLPNVRQTKELARSSRSSSFLSEHFVSFSESQLEAFLRIGTSRPMRTSVIVLVLSERLSFCNVFMLFMVWLMFVDH
jgi:hypothetical protein